MRLLIYGSGDFAPTVIELLRACGHEPVGLVDDFSQGANIFGSLKQVTSSHPPSKYGMAMAIGYNDLKSRWLAWQRTLAAGYVLPALIHPRAYVADSAHVGNGSLVMAGAVVDVRAVIGDAAVIWPSASVSHDARVGDNCFLSPNSTLCGFVQLGANSFVGAGAAVVERTEVPAGTFVKMLSIYPKRSS
jgi:sugar O-acyltransferase (sialic acid O-acetyltransferase NeuD family)